jgi:hypothetical protein
MGAVQLAGVHEVKHWSESCDVSGNVICDERAELLNLQGDLEYWGRRPDSRDRHRVSGENPALRLAGSTVQDAGPCRGQGQI